MRLSVFETWGRTAGCVASPLASSSRPSSAAPPDSPSARSERWISGRQASECAQVSLHTPNHGCLDGGRVKATTVRGGASRIGRSVRLARPYLAPMEFLDLIDIQLDILQIVGVLVDYDDLRLADGDEAGAQGLGHRRCGAENNRGARKKGAKTLPWNPPMAGPTGQVLRTAPWQGSRWGRSQAWRGAS